MKKFIMILVALLAMIAIDAKAQTTYSCLEVVDGETTGYAIDITITENNGAVTFSRNRRTATPSDEVVNYNITGITPTLQGNTVVVSLTGTNYFYIPFNMFDDATQTGNNQVSWKCLCHGKDDGCFAPEVTDLGNDNHKIQCQLGNCDVGCKSTNTTSGLSVQGILIAASSASEL